MYRLTTLSRLAGIGALVALAACDSKTDVLSPSLSGGNEMFHSYVALGNSLTSGYQSGGINDSTQKQSYARLLAMQMGTQYHYASLAGRGCTPPVANALTGALVGNAPAGTCDLRSTASVTDVLNNVAVPDAHVADPTSSSTPYSNALTTFILGGKTQVQRALDARPTFATIWIGNNDALAPTLSGLYQPIAITPAQFQTYYDAMISQLLAGAPDVKGVLLGIGKGQYLPQMVASQYITTTTMSAITGKAVTVDPGCATSTSLVNVVLLAKAIRAGTHPTIVACDKGIYPAPIGDVYVLDAAEQVTMNAFIDGLNTYISNKANAIGFAYYNPNIMFAAKRAAGTIPPFPNFSSGTAPFGTIFSLDGVHPNAAGHILVANDLIATINAKYGTTLKPLP